MVRPNSDSDAARPAEKACWCAESARRRYVPSLDKGEQGLSHIVQIQTQVRDAAAVQAACRRLGLPAPEQGTVKLFSGEATGLAVQLPDWKYPVVCDTASGQLQYDDFEGRWKG